MDWSWCVSSLWSVLCWNVKTVEAWTRFDVTNEDLCWEQWASCTALLPAFPQCHLSFRVDPHDGGPTWLPEEPAGVAAPPGRCQVLLAQCAPSGPVGGRCRPDGSLQLLRVKQTLPVQLLHLCRVTLPTLPTPLEYGSPLWPRMHTSWKHLCYLFDNLVTSLQYIQYIHIWLQEGFRCFQSSSHRHYAENIWNSTVSLK